MSGPSAFRALRFKDDTDEQAFFRSYCLGKLPLTRASLLVGGVILYVFYLWDRIIDPVHWEQTQVIRGLVVTPTVWCAALLLFIPRLQRHAETILSIGVILVTLMLMVVLSYITHAFDYEEPGALMILFFVATLLTMRLEFYVIVFAATWLIGAVAQMIVGDDRPGMLLVNNLYTGAAILLAMISVVTRELDARRKFQIDKDLQRSRDQVDNLLNAFLPPDEIARVRARSLRQPGRTCTIAISYRRADTDAIAGRIRDRLIGSFGRDAVFMDIDNIPFGEDFRGHIAKVLQTADILIALIGPLWLAETNGVSRLQDAADPVRVELELALASNLVILPVLVGGAAMPAAAQLPESLQAFAFRNAAEVESGRDFPHHMERLVRSIDEIFDGGSGRDRAGAGP